MRNFILLPALGALATTAATQPAPSLPAAVQKDVQCFLLFAAAVDRASAAKEDQAQQASSLAVMYYLGRLDVAAPGIDLAEVVRREATAMDSNPRAQAIGAECDSDFQKRGAELRSFGDHLQDPAPRSSSSS
jgi:hypothetical protein